MRKINKIGLSLYTTIVLGLSGCGGGGGGAATSSTTGYLVDSAVAGVEYSCGATTGLTGSDGAFSCSSFPVTFKIGSLTLGSISSLSSGDKVMPQDLVGVDRTNTSHNKVLNLAVLLQSLDDDGNPDNGISISSSIRGSLNSSVDIQNVTLNEVSNIVSSVGKSYVDINTARNHLRSNTPELQSSNSSSSSSSTTTSSTTTSSSSSSSSSSSTTDTTPPNAPTLISPTQTHYVKATTDINITYIIEGEVGTKIYINNMTENDEINASGRGSIIISIYESLNNPHDTIDFDFNLTLRDSAGNISPSLFLVLNIDTVAPSRFDWGNDVNTIGNMTNRIATFDENITTTGVSITASNGGTISNIAVVDNNISFDYNKSNNEENLTIQGTDLAGNTFNITKRTTFFISGETWKGLVYETVTSPVTGRVWLDRNLGASQVCTALDDTNCYGDYYQWGRDTDGHEKSNSSTTATLATDLNTSGNSSFITNGSSPYDWVETTI